MLKKNKVLIVDDEYAFCKLLFSFFSKNGYEAKFTTNGEHALDMIVEEKPDIMTLDIRMPGINGYEVLEKAMAAQPELKVIVISAIDVPNFEESLKGQGASGVFYKPVDLGLLLKTVQGFS